MIDPEARKRIQALEERGVQRDLEIAGLSVRLSHGVAELARLAHLIEPIRGVSGQKAPSVPLPSPSAIPRAPPSATASPGSLAPTGFTSLIVSQFPVLFAEFAQQQFTLLWRGSRDGFQAKHFHGRCDGHAPTLTFIADKQGNVFGGFTPVSWESSSGRFKEDPSEKSFLFTLKNRQNVPARQFALRPGSSDKAIWCDLDRGPCFGNDFFVYDNCNANATSATRYFGDEYANDTGLDGTTFFTGSPSFTVKEIEVFEMTD
jgi:hypothetical protein